MGVLQYAIFKEQLFQKGAELIMFSYYIRLGQQMHTYPQATLEELSIRAVRYDFLNYYHSGNHFQENCFQVAQSYSSLKWELNLNQVPPLEIALFTILN